MSGKELLLQVAENSDLPRHLLSDEVRELLKKNNIREQDLTLDQLRDLVAAYLQDVFVSVKEELK